jgi:hypothetical protein
MTSHRFGNVDNFDLQGLVGNPWPVVYRSVNIAELITDKGQRIIIVQRQARLKNL